MIKSITYSENGPLVTGLPGVRLQIPQGKIYTILEIKSFTQIFARITCNTFIDDLLRYSFNPSPDDNILSIGDDIKGPRMITSQFSGPDVWRGITSTTIVFDTNEPEE